MKKIFQWYSNDISNYSRALEQIRSLFSEQISLETLQNLQKAKVLKLYSML